MSLKNDESSHMTNCHMGAVARAWAEHSHRTCAKFESVKLQGSGQQARAGSNGMLWDEGSFSHRVECLQHAMITPAWTSLLAILSWAAMLSNPSSV